MKRIAAIIAALLIAAAPAYAAGISVDAEIPVENNGAAGVFELVKDEETINSISLGAGEKGSFLLHFDTLDSFDYVIRQSVPRAEGQVEYDSSEYVVRITTLLADGDIPSAFYSAQKKGEDGKAERIQYFNYVLQVDPAPQTGDSGHAVLYAALSAAGIAGAVITFCLAKKRSLR